MRVTAVLTLRNEAAFVLEWLSYHLTCGFTDILVFSNDCTDGTDSMLDRLEELGHLTHVRNDGPHRTGPQWTALKAADRHPLVKRADWLMALDIDEFVNIHAGDHTISALLAALPDATAIPMTWRLFGNAGVVGYDDQPVAETFVLAAPSILHWPWRGSMFKTLFRNDGSYAKLGVHRPRSPDLDRMAAQRWLDGSGHRLPDTFHTSRVFTDPGQDVHALVQLNHYALGSMESFLLKCDRGRANREGSDMNMDYWVDRNFCQEPDRSISRLDSTGLRAELHRDAVLGPLHDAAVIWRKERIAVLMGEESWRSLYGKLLMTPPARALDRAEAESIWRRRRP